VRLSAQGPVVGGTLLSIFPTSAASPGGVFAYSNPPIAGAQPAPLAGQAAHQKCPLCRTTPNRSGHGTDREPRSP